MHVEIDGSGMLEAAPGSRRLEAPGDTFEMEMDRTDSVTSRWASTSPSTR